MEIIIIDDGVNEDCFNIGILKHNLEVLENLDIVERKNYNKEISSHGSICSGIIKKYSPNCKIGSIKVMNPELCKGTSKQLLAALKWCLESNVQLINMSLGSIDFRDYEQIRTIIAKLLENKCIIVAACHNRNYFSIPACLSGVIGVISEHSYIDNQYMVNNNYLEKADFYGSGRHTLKDYNNEDIEIYPANSYAAPLITSQVYNIISHSKYKKVCQIKEELASIVKPKDIISGLGYCIRPDFIDSAIILNYSNDKLSEWLFFKDYKIYNSPNLQEIILDKEYCNVIILPNNADSQDTQFNKDIYNFIKFNKKYINGILYGGVMPEKLKVLCENEVYCLIWDEDAYKRLIDEYIPQNIECNIPLIGIEGESDCVITAMSLLEKEFYDDDYNIIKASSIKESYLYGIEYLPESINPTTIFQYFEERYESNGIIFGNEKITIEDIDILIILKEEENVLEYLTNKIIVSSHILEKNIKEIYKYIIKCFKEDEG